MLNDEWEPDEDEDACLELAEKEYAEARITQAIFSGAEIPSFQTLAIDPVPYLHGLGEAVGEMRRRMLDLLRDEQITEAEQMLEAMDRALEVLDTQRKRDVLEFAPLAQFELQLEHMRDCLENGRPHRIPPSDSSAARLTPRPPPSC